MLHVWLMSQHSPLFVWRPEQNVWQPQADWQQLSDSFGEQSVCLYFPSRHLQQVSTELSSAQLKQLGETGRQYLFEETSLTPVEQLSVRELHHLAGQQLFAVAKNDLSAWQQSALLGGYSISALLPDFLLLPVPEEGAGQQLSLYRDEFTTLIRQSETQGMAVSYLPLVMDRLPHLNEVCVLQSVNPPNFQPNLSSTQVSDSTTTPESAQNIVSPVASNRIDLTQSSQSAADQASWENQLRSDIIITQLSSQPVPIQAPERHPLNFYVKPAHLGVSPYLRVTMMVTLVALVCQLSADALQQYQYNKAAKATKLAIEAQYNAWFPDEPFSPTNQLQLQLNPKLASDSAAQSEHLAVLSRVAPLIKQSSLSAQSLTIEPTSLSFTIVGNSRDSLDKFASTLVDQGINASLGRVDSRDQNKVAGQVTIAVTPSVIPADSTTAAS